MAGDPPRRVRGAQGSGERMVPHAANPDGRYETGCGHDAPHPGCFAERAVAEV